MLGHEAAGVVEEVGEAVTSVSVGDHVVLTTLANCGQCAACDRGRPTRCPHAVGSDSVPNRFTWRGTDAFQFADVGASLTGNGRVRDSMCCHRPRCASALCLPHRLRRADRSRCGF